MIIPEAMCPVCRGLFGYTMGISKYHVNPRAKPRPSVIHVHGPRKNRCPGSRQPILSWMEATQLPTWDDMSELDKGCALMFVWKVHWEKSYPYARSNYPCRYKEHPELVALCEKDACRHARVVTGGYKAIDTKLGEEEFLRLYNKALDYERGD